MHFEKTLEVGILMAKCQNAMSVGAATTGVNIENTQFQRKNNNKKAGQRYSHPKTNLISLKRVNTYKALQLTLSENQSTGRPNQPLALDQVRQTSLSTTPAAATDTSAQESN